MTLPRHFIKKIRDTAPDMVVFGVMRNEMLRLHPWLRHYREMGVDSFAIIDNGSTDGTYETLNDEPGVSVVQLDESFSAANFGVEWLNDFHRRVKPGTWILFADADEFLVYRGWPDRTLLDLAQEAQAQGASAVFGFLLDMYPDGPLEQATPGSQDNLFRVAPCFDSKYLFRVRPRKPWERGRRALEVVGGPRVRLLSSLDREAGVTWIGLFVRGQLDRLLRGAPSSIVPWLVRTMPKQMPSLCKMVLARSGNGISYTNNHGGEGACFFRENVVVCHFKFLADFESRVRLEAQRGEHYRCGAEYIMYADALNARNEIDLRYDGTLRFEGAERFVQLGLIRDISRFVPPPQHAEADAW